MKLKSLAVAGAVSMLMIGTACADDLSFYSTDGPMLIHIAPDGRINGLFKQDRNTFRGGRLVGSVGRDNTIRGFWMQDVSDHPCTSQREGTMSWGMFMISAARGGQP